MSDYLHTNEQRTERVATRSAREWLDARSSFGGRFPCFFLRSDLSRYSPIDGRYEVFGPRGWTLADRGLASTFERVEAMAYRALVRKLGHRAASERAFALALRNRDLVRAGAK